MSKPTTQPGILPKSLTGQVIAPVEDSQSTSVNANKGTIESLYKTAIAVAADVYSISPQFKVKVFDGALYCHGVPAGGQNVAIAAIIAGAVVPLFTLTVTPLAYEVVRAAAVVDQTIDPAAGDTIRITSSGVTGLATLRLNFETQP